MNPIPLNKTPFPRGRSRLDLLRQMAKKNKYYAYSLRKNLGFLNEAETKVLVKEMRL